MASPAVPRGISRAFWSTLGSMEVRVYAHHLWNVSGADTLPQPQGIRGLHPGVVGVSLDLEA